MGYVGEWVGTLWVHWEEAVLLEGTSDAILRI
jgi:hypothetical protein